MAVNYLLLILTEGLIFALFAYGIYLSFQWLRFPDLTPDGSFVIGACAYVQAVTSGVEPAVSLVVAFMAGAACGSLTGILSRILRIPPVIAGLMMSLALYSVAWKILGKPNQYLERSLTLVGNMTGMEYNTYLLLYLMVLVGIVTVLISVLSNTTWGIRLKAIGENPLIAKEIVKSETLSYIGLLALSNGIVGLTGALFLQRSFAADINMGTGQTIVGLIGMVVGLLLASSVRNGAIVLVLIALGSILYKAVMFATLALGLSAELFRLTSVLILVALFLVMSSKNLTILKGLRWK